MLKQIFNFLILIICISSIFAANVNSNIIVETEETTFNYIIKFNLDENYDSFSFEKPKDSTIISATNKLNETQSYSVAGDYFIFKTDKTSNETYTIKFKSKTTSKILNQENKFNTYINFNFPVNSFDLKVDIFQKFETIDEIFPREYTILKDGKFEWKLLNLEKDSLFLINFKNKIILDTNSTNLNSNTTKTNNQKLIDKYIILLLLIASIFLVVFIIGIRKIVQIINHKNKEIKTTSIITENINKKEIENIKSADSTTQVQSKETFEEFIVKYLTENEKEVVLVVVENEGLLQNEILNFIPKMKKSNLSKIITKLHSRRILNRIKVGKVNKIHLGGKLEEILSREKEN